MKTTERSPRGTGGAQHRPDRGRAALGDERLRALRDHGAAMDTDTAVAYTLSRLDVFLTNADA